ncbi:chaplin family protein [Streptomyces sp. NPDC049577]|uniref:chaplin family protein n=1 Tax=Streptomyces sp. NPDC049577 TaxID=3155153 RepID=UPI00343A044C
MSTVVVTAAIVSTGVAAAAPAAAGGIGDFLSPAFGNGCMNQHGTHALGSTTHGTGAGNGNLAGLPIGAPVNQCGGADLPINRENVLLEDIPKELMGEFGKPL